MTTPEPKCFWKRIVSLARATIASKAIAGFQFRSSRSVEFQAIPVSPDNKQNQRRHLFGGAGSSEPRLKDRAMSRSWSMRLWRFRLLICAEYRPEQNPVLRLQRRLCCSRAHAMNLLRVYGGEEALERELAKWSTNQSCPQP